MQRPVLLVVASSMLLSGGCRRPSAPARSLPTAARSAPTSTSPLRFRAQELPFTYERGETGAAWPVETTGGGVGLLDYDGDGRLDLFFSQGGPLLENKDNALPPGCDVLLRNLGEGRFEDVSARAGLIPKGYGQGVTVADYDGD